MKRAARATLCLSLALASAGIAGKARAASRCVALGEEGFEAEACLVGSDEPRGPEVSATRTEHGVEDFLFYRSAPVEARATYELHAPPGSTMAIDGGGVGSMADAAGRTRLRIERPWVRDATGTRTFARLEAECAGDGTCRISVDWSGIPVRYPLLVDPTWTVLPNEFLCSPRQFHTATLIGSNSDFAGQVLIVGGLDDQNNPTASVELYNPEGAAPHLTQCRSLARPRAYHTATWVRVPVDGGAPKGMVLIVGGYGTCDNGPTCDPSDMLDTYELYDPGVNCNSTLSCAGCDCPPSSDVEVALPDGLPRAEHSATVLGSDLDAGGAVIITGGSLSPLSSVLRFETDGTWSILLATVPSRFGHTATYVTAPPGSTSSNPLIFLAGGNTTPVGAPQAEYADTDLILGSPWDAPISVPPSADTAGPRPARSSSASLVDAGRVFLWGGSVSTPAEVLDFGPYFNSAAPPTPTVVPLDPATQFARNSVAVDTLAIPALHGAVLVGGLLQNTGCQTVTETPYFNGADFNPAGQLVTPRMNHTVTPILGGRGLVAVGGAYYTGPPCFPTALNTVESIAISQLGDPCTSDTECVTGYCADQVCCNEACPHDPGTSTACQSCSPQGMCLPSPQGTACGGAGGCPSVVCDGTLRMCPSSGDASTCTGEGEDASDANADAVADGPAEAQTEPAIEAGPPAASTEKDTLLSCSMPPSRRPPRSIPVGLFVSALALLARRVFPRRRRRAVRR
jgi:hypothetical protein